MGNKYIHSYINNYHIEKEKYENLKKLFEQYTGKSGLLKKENFNRIMRLDDEKISEKLFLIFAGKDKTINLRQFINIYAAFRIPSFKNILLTFLILENLAKIEKSKYIEIIKEFSKTNKNFEKLSDPEAIEFFSCEEAQGNKLFKNYETGIVNPNDETFIQKDILLKYIETNEKNLKLSFFKQIKQSSELFKKNKKFKEHYVCDCIKNYLELNKSNDLFTSIKNPFQNDKKLIEKGRMSLINLEKLMKEYCNNQKLIDLILKYLDLLNMKNSINFDDFRNLMIDINPENRKAFLYKVILKISNQKDSIKGSQLKEILKIENNECILEDNIDRTAFENIKDQIINSEINTYLSCMKNLYLIPFIRYNLQAKEKNLKKQIIKYILNNKTVEEYLIENFDKNNYFYPINKEFWNSLIDDKDESELKINNSLIAEKDEIYYISKKEEEKKNENQTENKDKNEKENKNEKQKNEENKEKIKNKKKEKNEKESEKNKQKNDEGQNKKEEKEIKDKNEIKDENKEGEDVNKKEKIKEQKKEPIKGKLKNNMKYGEDYFIICGDLYKKIKNNFEFDYLVELEKTTIFLEPKKTEEKKEENKVEIKNEKKDCKNEKKENEKI